jgi:beta-galactosidase
LSASILPQLIPLTLLAAAASHGAGFFPVSVWYGGGKARAPMLEADARSKKELWRQDIRQIKALGFNTVRTWIDWATGEPREQQYRFDNLEVILELARDEGLKVFLQVYMDSAPQWVGRKHPDSLFVSSDGSAVKPESSPGYCMDHPAVRRADLAFYAALAERVKNHPAFLGWDLWSEPHVINWANPTYIAHPEFCFCRNTLERFRTWLKRKYGTLEKLNAAWYRQYETWEEVEPGRMSTILSYTDYIDWKTFLAGKLAEDLRARYSAVKQRMPDAIVTSHTAGVGLFVSPHHWEGQGDDWSMAQQVDYYGTSFYPKHSAFVDRDPIWRAALLDFTRSFGFAGDGRGFHIGELQGGFGTIALNVSPTVTPEDLRMWTWSALSRGAKGIHYYAWYPMSSGYESGGFGLIHLDGAITERARVAGSIARVVDRNQDLFLNSRPPKAEVAVIYNPLAHFVGGRQRATSYGGPQGEVASIERDSLLGVHKALFPSNVPLDYVHIHHLGDGVLQPYKLVYLAYPLMLPEASIAALKQYVAQGGALVAEARLGWTNERGIASDRIPGMGLWEVMGCRETDVQTGEKGLTSIRWTGGDFPRMRPGDLLRARWYEETLEPLSAQASAVAEFSTGRPAAIVSRYGKGRTLMLGSYVSAAYQSVPTAEVERFFAGLLDWAGVATPVAGVRGNIEVRMLESGRETLVFAFNHARTAVAAEFQLPGLRPAVAVDLESGEKLAQSGEPMQFRKQLPGYGVWILRLTPR